MRNFDRETKELYDELFKKLEEFGKKGNSYADMAKHQMDIYSLLNKAFQTGYEQGKKDGLNLN